MDPSPVIPPAPASPNSIHPPVQPSGQAAKRSRLFYLGLASLVMAGICCLLSLILLAVAARTKLKTPASGAVFPDNRPAATSLMAGINPALPWGYFVSTNFLANASGNSLSRAEIAGITQAE